MIQSMETAPVNTSLNSDYADLMFMTFLERKPTTQHVFEPMLILGDSIYTEYLSGMQQHIVEEHAGGIKFTHMFVSSDKFVKDKMVLVATNANGYPTVRYVDAITRIMGYDTLQNMSGLRPVGSVMLDLYFMYNDNNSLRNYIERNPEIARYIGSTVCSDLYSIITMLHDHASVNYDRCETPELDLLSVLSLPPYPIMNKSAIFNMAMVHKPLITSKRTFNQLARRVSSNSGICGYIPYEEQDSIVSENLSQIIDLLSISDVSNECTLNFKAVEEFMRGIGLQSTGDIYIKPMDFICMDSNGGPVIFDLCTVNLLAPCVLTYSQLKEIFPY